MMDSTSRSGYGQSVAEKNIPDCFIPGGRKVYAEVKEKEEKKDITLENIRAFLLGRGITERYMCSTYDVLQGLGQDDENLRFDVQDLLASDPEREWKVEFGRFLVEV